MILNCDIGERGAGHPVDDQLMPLIGMANIACGGHAGDADSARWYADLARRYGAAVSLHLSYPDRENFGRRTMAMSRADLHAALTGQAALLPGVRCVKFHGALYNDAAKDEALAESLADWLKASGMKTVIAPGESALARQARRAGLAILAEAFADRRYVQDNGLALMPRNRSGAVMESVEDALEQCSLLQDGQVRAAGRLHPLACDTLCIHSDSAIALPLARALQLPFTGELGPLQRIVRAPLTGQQDIGVSPGGPQDRFSFAAGQRLLEREEQQALEFILPPKLTCWHDSWVVLTGAHFAARRVAGEDEQEIPHGQVVKIRAGEQLQVGKCIRGFRGYLHWRAAGPGSDALGDQPPFVLPEKPPWSADSIRLLKGSEWEMVPAADRLTGGPWQVLPGSDGMALRLAPREPVGVRELPADMLSVPVCDGTVQFAPEVTYVLMRGRQTVGGYPRAAQVIEVDLDRLAQVRPGEWIHFEWTTLAEARRLLRLRDGYLPDG